MKLAKWMMVPVMMMVLVACSKPAEKAPPAAAEKAPAAAEKPAEQPK